MLTTSPPHNFFNKHQIFRVTLFMSPLHHFANCFKFQVCPVTREGGVVMYTITTTTIDTESHGYEDGSPVTTTYPNTTYPLNPPAAVGACGECPKGIPQVCRTCPLVRQCYPDLGHSNHFYSPYYIPPYLLPYYWHSPFDGGDYIVTC